MAKSAYGSLGGIESNLIRILVLIPAKSPHAPIVCRLVTLQQPAQRKYEAVSYTWDNQKRTQAIQCDGSTVLVTPNVESAMRHLRRRHFTRRLWIDSVCIDQDNHVEKLSQIPRMDAVYRNAKRVIIWLGEGTTDTDRAFSMLKWTLPLYRLGLNLPLCRYKAKNSLLRFRADFQHVLDHKNPDTTPLQKQGSALFGLHNLVHHSWFRRIWTLQEISMARRATVQCGHATMPWSCLSNMLTFESTWWQNRVPHPIKEDGGYNPSSSLRQPAFVERIHQINCLREWVRDSTRSSLIKSTTRPPPTFIINLILAGINPRYESSDPKDRFYGLLGLLRIFGTGAAPFALAEPTISTIHRRVFETMAIRSNSVQMLIHTNGEPSQPDLPSWLPSHSPVPWTPGFDDSLFDALIPDPPSPVGTISFDRDSKSLELRGRFIDEIKGVTSGRSDGEQLGQPTSVDTFYDKIKSWISFVRHQVNPLNLSYHDEALLLFKMLLHPQVSNYYRVGGVIGPFYTSPGLLGPFPTAIPFRLLLQFEAWLETVETGRNPGFEDNFFDAVQHFISSEAVNSRSEGDHADITIGYPRALAVMERWVDEQTLRKRLFCTQRGYVGIAWRCVESGDKVVLADGLATPLVVRPLGGGDGISYRLLGPCHIPYLPSVKMWEGLPVERRVFRIV